jgi:hypothetical protein
VAWSRQFRIANFALGSNFPLMTVSGAVATDPA